ncbi:MAG TPA: bifunctional DNA primase/polymerase [Geothrix sp.]|nr:bifunctional DNA primase/polymerase [Geothrix sp.]
MATLADPAAQEQAATLEHALDMAGQGFRVFPLRPKGELYTDRDGNECVSDGKPPAVTLDRATTNTARIRRWLASGANYGVMMGAERTNPATGEPERLVAVDIDLKKGKDGRKAFAKACADAGIDPNDHDTFTVQTPTGGLHLYYWTAEPIKQGADVLGEGSGVDTRAGNGYLVGPGSALDGKPYRVTHAAPIASMGALAAIFPKATTGSAVVDRAPLPGVDPDRARIRAVEHLKTSPGAKEGSRGSTAYKVAARLKDFGCTEGQALDLMLCHWNEKCDPPMPTNDLAESVNHAFRYGTEAPGSSAPEAVFPLTSQAEGEAEALHPFEAMNQRFAFTPAGGGHIIQEATDHKGRFLVKHVDLGSFHNDHANQPWTAGQKVTTISKAWMSWGGRRRYEGFVFDPSGKADPERWFNLWRGFAVEPAATPGHPAVEAFLEHARLNVCNGDHRLFQWLMAWFGQLIQRPWEKPLVALVFKGKKGTGKNALVERVGHLLGTHFLVADDDRYLLSNFNGHLENCLCMVLDEATWAGDKKAEGRLKGIITGSQHNIERKGMEPYRVDNLTRIVILGNEDWLVPASQDERRFAVFNVGDGRRQDRQFFQSMREGMEAGGYSHLLSYFLTMNLAGFDANDAPNTQGLVEQKHASLKGPERWLADVLTDGEIPGRMGGYRWEATGLQIPKAQAYESYSERARRQYGEHHPQDERTFWKLLRTILPGVSFQRPSIEGMQVRTVTFPPLDVARRGFEEKALGGSIDWGEPAKPSGFDGCGAVDIFS